MVQVINDPSTKWPKHVACLHCDEKLRYSRKDVRYGDSFSPDGTHTGQDFFVTCPLCSREVTINNYLLPQDLTEELVQKFEQACKGAPRRILLTKNVEAWWKELETNWPKLSADQRHGITLCLGSTVDDMIAIWQATSFNQLATARQTFLVRWLAKHPGIWPLLDI